MTAGWAPASTVAAFRTQRELLRRALDDAGRDPETFAVSKRVYIGVDADERRARRRLDDYLHLQYGPGAPPPEVAVVGSPERCLQALREIVAAGAGHLALTPVFDDLEHVDLLADLLGGGALDD